MIEIAEILQQGSYQLFKLPKSIRLDSQHVLVKQTENALILISLENPWQSLFDSLDKFSNDFMELREQPTQPVRENLFECRYSYWST